jgi:hypothetical protein
MVMHVVMWKLKDRAEGKDRSENAQRMKEALESLAPSIPCIRKIVVGTQDQPDPNAWDVFLMAQFDNHHDLEIYQNHPEHVRVRSWIQKVREERSVVDAVIRSSQE